MRAEWDIRVEMVQNHLTVSLKGYEHIGGATLRFDSYPIVDLICDPSEDPKHLLKDAMVALIERL